jgi:hypothetical protein
LLALEDPAEELGCALGDGTMTPLAEGDKAALEKVMKSDSMRSARDASRTARLTSSLRPNERLSKLVEPTTVQRLSTMRTLA